MARPIKTVTVDVMAIDEPVPGVKRFVLADPDGWTLPAFRPGAHIDVHLVPHLVRTYSLCNNPADDARYVIAVKVEPTGRGGSRTMHEQLKVGSRIGVSLPRAGISIIEDGLNVFIAGGIGITPFISAILDMERRGKSNYILHWSSMGRPSLLDMLGDSKAAGRVRLYDTLVDPLPDISGIVAEAGSQGKAFCCGPAAMLDAFEAAVSEWPQERKHVERFTAPKLPANPIDQPYELVLARSGRQMSVNSGVSLQDALEELDADVSISCGGGICGACRTHWIEGPPVHRDRVLSDAERAHDVMVCVAGCAGSRLVLDL